VKYYISIVFLFVSLSLNAQTTATTDKQCQYAGDIKFFPQSLIMVNQIKHDLCSNKNKAYTFPEIAEAINPAVVFFEKEYESQFPGYTTWIQPWLAILKDIPNMGEEYRLKKFDVNLLPAVLILQYGSENLSPAFSKSDCIDCSRAIVELGKLIQHLIDGFMERDLTKTKDYYAALSKSWGRYLEESRSQTWLDELATSTFYSPDKEKLIGPPSTQYFFFHPTVVIENVSNAIDGEQQKEAIGLELFGFNWWQTTIPFGASIGWVQADRQSAKDLGTAIFLHLDNAYTLGYSKHDDDSGWFITVDLLKTFSDKRSELKVWKENFSN
jgi:hypothetical protein